MRCSVLLMILAASTTWAQVAESRVFIPRPLSLLRPELTDDRDEVRERAVIELGHLRPTDSAQAELIARLLAGAMRDPELGVRANATSAFLSHDRPSDIAIPALIGALARAPDDTTSRTMWGLRRTDETPDQFDLWLLRGALSTLLRALDRHWDDRAVRGLADVVRGWPLNRMPGDTVEAACEMLCRWGTRDALDAVVDTLARGKLLPLIDRGMWVYEHPRRKYVGLLDRDHRDRIGVSLVRRLADAGASPSAGVYEGSKEAWQELLRKEGSRVPVHLPDSRPTSRPTSPSSRPGKEK